MVTSKTSYKRERTEEEKAAIPPMGIDQINQVESILGYCFNDKKLLEEALTHASYYLPFKPETCYERLEFIGDSVLNCLVAHWVFNLHPDFSPGLLTRLKAANVDTEKLARIAICSELYLYIRHKAPVLNEQIQDFMEGMKDHPCHSNGLLDPPKVLADIVESLLGAIFMDSSSSMETVWKTFKKLADPLIDHNNLGRHPVAELNELCQKNKFDLKFIDTWAKSTNFTVVINGTPVGTGTYANKKDIAMNRAAKSALDRLREGVWELNLIEKKEDAMNPQGGTSFNSMFYIFVSLLVIVVFHLLFMVGTRTVVD